MGEGLGGSGKSVDPFEPFRGMRDAYLDAMAKAMVEAVNSEGYAQATGAMLDGYLTASEPFREALDQSMTHALQQLSLPSRQELAVLAERFTNVEMRLDDLDAKLDEIARKFSAPKPAAGPDTTVPAVKRAAAAPPHPAPANTRTAQKRVAKAKAKSAPGRNSRKRGR